MVSIRDRLRRLLGASYVARTRHQRHPQAYFHRGDHGHRRADGNQDFLLGSRTMWEGLDRIQDPLLWAIGFLFLSHRRAAVKPRRLANSASINTLHNHITWGRIPLRGWSLGGGVSASGGLFCELFTTGSRRCRGGPAYNETFGQIHFWTTFSSSPHLLPEAFLGTRRMPGASAITLTGLCRLLTWFRRRLIHLGASTCSSAASCVHTLWPGGLVGGQSLG